MTTGEWAVTGTATVTVLQWALIPRLLAQRCKSPNATLAWLWALLLFPGFGALLYLLIGSERVFRRRLALTQSLDSQLEQGHLNPRGHPATVMPDLPELEKVNGFAPTAGP